MNIFERNIQERTFRWGRSPASIEGYPGDSRRTQFSQLLLKPEPMPTECRRVLLRRHRDSRCRVSSMRRRWNFQLQPNRVGPLVRLVQFLVRISLRRTPTARIELPGFQGEGLRHAYLQADVDSVIVITCSIHLREAILNAV